ncbi:MAG: radical SAM protein [Eubacteriales bacterium]|nr:radical SAM protein [Eubacteriales bacterium]
MKHCMLCPRCCGADRASGRRGRCHADGRIYVARAALHMWEEPCISGEEGSGAVFFSGCSLGCIFCQNHEISGTEPAGREVSIEKLSDIFLKLQGQGANNINLVTAAHYIPQTAAAIRIAKENGLIVPVVYNSSGYEKAESLKMLEGLVDIYLPDFKYMSRKLAEEYSGAPDYPECAKEALSEMVRQIPGAEFDRRGIMKKGIIVRHLMLPGHLPDSKKVVRYLYETHGDHIYISMMNQYTPVPAVKEHPHLGRKVRKKEYEALLDYAISLGVENGFFQEGETAEESFIPAFNGEGAE